MPVHLSTSELRALGELEAAVRATDPALLSVAATALGFLRLHHLAKL